MRINYDKMEQFGFAFDNLDDVFFYFSSMLDWLERHNKNYTKEQYIAF